MSSRTLNGARQVAHANKPLPRWVRLGHCPLLARTTGPTPVIAVVRAARPAVLPRRGGARERIFEDRLAASDAVNTSAPFGPSVTTERRGTHKLVGGLGAPTVASRAARRPAATHHHQAVGGFRRRWQPHPQAPPQLDQPASHPPSQVPGRDVGLTATQTVSTDRTGTDADPGGKPELTCPPKMATTALLPTWSRWGEVARPRP